MNLATKYEEFINFIETSVAVDWYQWQGHLDQIPIRELVIESVYLELWTRFEDVLRFSFLWTCAGHENLRGAVSNGYLNAPSMEHAERIVKGRDTFADWGNINKTIQRCELYFPEGGVHKRVLAGKMTPLNHARFVRNEISHKSADSREKFLQTVRHFLNEPSPTIRPGEFLLARTRIGQPIIALEKFCQEFREVADACCFGTDDEV